MNQQSVSIVGGFVSFAAVLPFEDFGPNFLNPNPHPYKIEKPLRTIYLLHGITGDEKTGFMVQELNVMQLKITLQ